MPTLKQLKTAEITLDNIGKTPLMTKGDILAQAGYSAGIVKNPKEVFETKGYKQSMEELKAKLGIDKKSRIALLAEIMTERKKDGSLADKRSVIEANKEITKMEGEYEQIQKIQELESDQDRIIE